MKNTLALSTDEEPLKGSEYVHCRCKKENAQPLPTDEATLKQMLM
jgi:hypothetical protein